jgi:hypothetical protein
MFCKIVFKIGFKPFLVSFFSESLFKHNYPNKFLDVIPIDNSSLDVAPKDNTFRF